MQSNASQLADDVPMTICPFYHLTSENQKDASQTKTASQQSREFQKLAKTKGIVYLPRAMGMVEERRQLFDSVALQKQEERSDKPLVSSGCNTRSKTKGVGFISNQPPMQLEKVHNHPFTSHTYANFEALDHMLKTICDDPYHPKAFDHESESKIGQLADAEFGVPLHSVYPFNPKLANAMTPILLKVQLLR